MNTLEDAGRRPAATPGLHVDTEAFEALILHTWRELARTHRRLTYEDLAAQLGMPVWVVRHCVLIVSHDALAPKSPHAKNDDPGPCTAGVVTANKKGLSGI